MKPSPSKTNRGTLSAILAWSLFSGVLLLTSPASGQTPPSCNNLYPIALSASSLTGVNPGDTLTNIWNGVQPGNFGWLSWTGDPGETTLVNSLTGTGDSYTYVNPYNANDHNLVVGDWVSARPGVANGKHVRTALDALKTIQIVVPVWDQATGEGDNALYHISGFAMVQITSYDLASQNQISAIFGGYAACGGAPND